MSSSLLTESLQIEEELADIGYLDISPQLVLILTITCIADGVAIVEEAKTLEARMKKFEMKANSKERLHVARDEFFISYQRPRFI